MSCSRPPVSLGDATVLTVITRDRPTLQGATSATARAAGIDAAGVARRHWPEARQEPADAPATLHVLLVEDDDAVDDVPVVVLTGMQDDEGALAAIEAGAQDYWEPSRA